MTCWASVTEEPVKITGITWRIPASYPMLDVQSHMPCSLDDKLSVLNTQIPAHPQISNQP